MMKKDNRSLDDMICHYQTELLEQLDRLCEGLPPTGRYKEWSLFDCFEMTKFYQLIENRQFKRAYNKLPYLWKECALVPNSLQVKLSELYE